MKKSPYYITLFILAFAVSESFGQSGSSQNCTQTLRTARTTYEQGRLHEIPTILDGCLRSGDFTSSQKVEAYRILILTYIYLEEPAKADEEMLNLLRTDNFFKINPASDPVEFQALYRKFRTDPLFNVGFKFGANTSQVNVIQNHFIWASAEGAGEYSSVLGIQGGFLFEKYLLYKKFKGKLVLNPELFFNTSATNYTNNKISFRDTIANDVDNMLFKTTQRRLQLNLLCQYKLGKSKFSPYIAIGPGLGYLLSSSTGGELSSGSQLNIPDQTLTENFKSLGISLIGSAGIKYQVGSFFLTADVRYQHGFGNIVKSEKRYALSEANQKLLNLGYVSNDYSLSQSMVNIGIIVPYFKPKKLIK